MKHPLSSYIKPFYDNRLHKDLHMQQAAFPCPKNIIGVR